MPCDPIRHLKYKMKNTGDREAAVRHAFQKGWEELGTQGLLGLVLGPVGKVLHHGHIRKSSIEALAAR